MSVAFKCARCGGMGKLSPRPEVGEVLECFYCKSQIKVSEVKWRDGEMVLVVEDVK